LIRASVGNATLQISQFVYITGSLAFDKGAVKTVNVTGGLLTGITGPVVDAILGPLHLSLPSALSIPATGATTTELSFMTIGASNVHAFVGMGGPYFTDIDGDGQVSWSFNTGNGDDASRTLAAGSSTITIGSTAYTAGGAHSVLPP